MQPKAGGRTNDGGFVAGAERFDDRWVGIVEGLEVARAWRRCTDTTGTRSASIVGTDVTSPVIGSVTSVESSTSVTYEKVVRILKILSRIVRLGIRPRVVRAVHGDEELSGVDGQNATS